MMDKENGQRKYGRDGRFLMSEMGGRGGLAVHREPMLVGVVGLILVGG